MDFNIFRNLSDIAILSSYMRTYFCCYIWWNFSVSPQIWRYFRKLAKNWLFLKTPSLVLFNYLTVKANPDIYIGNKTKSLAYFVRVTGIRSLNKLRTLHYTYQLFIIFFANLALFYQNIFAIILRVKKFK